MKTDAVIEFFGDRPKALEAIRYTRGSFTHWEKKLSGVIPLEAAGLLYLASGRKLDMGWDDYEPQLAAKRAA